MRDLRQRRCPISTPTHCKKTSGYRVARSSRCRGALLAFGATSASTSTEDIASEFHRPEQLPFDCCVKSPLRHPSLIIYRTKPSSEML
jgi:hypothetical protein